jgi:DNA-binding NtrC family response regulator
MQPPATGRAHGLVGQSKEMTSIRRHIDKASRKRLPVPLLGESGTGKEVVARAIHNAAPGGQCVPIDCGSLADADGKRMVRAQQAIVQRRCGE